jgi:hypothetical protein
VPCFVESRTGASDEHALLLYLVLEGKPAFFELQHFDGGSFTMT